MTVDGGELYVADGSNAEYRLDKFDASSGAFVSQFPQAPGLSWLHQGVAVGHGTGETQVYVAGDETGSGTSEGAVAVFGAAGSLLGVWKGADTPSGSFACFECQGPADVAVDDSSTLGDWAAGDVYVADPEHMVVNVFTPEAEGKEKLAAEPLTGPSPGEPFNEPDGVAVNRLNGDLLVTDTSLGERGRTGKVVDIFKPAALSGQYEFVGRLTGPPDGTFSAIADVATDGSNGNIFVADQNTAVYEFSAEGSYLGRIAGEQTPAGTFSSVNSVAVDPGTHHVFVGDGRAVDVFGPDLVIPDVTTESASNVRPESATLNGTVNPDNAGEATCRFDWGTTHEFGQVAQCSEPVDEGGSPVPVQVVLSGLRPDTTYYYRLQATNANGTNLGEAAQDRQFTTPGPGIDEESSSSVTSSSATLDASINPHNAPTSYYFQYGPSTGYGTDVPAAPGLTIGSSEGDVQVSRHVQDLLASTTYHYRVVAVSELAPGVFEAFNGPDETLTTQPVGGSSVLPDGRAWEMVTPADKLGAQLLGIGGNEAAAIQASAAGNAITYVADAPTEIEPPGYTNLLQAFAARGPAGWTSRDISIPHDKSTGIAIGFGQEYRFFSEDLSLGAVEPFGSFMPSLSAEASEPTAYLSKQYLGGDVTDQCSGSCYRPLVTGAAGFANVPAGTVFGEEAEGKCQSSDSSNLICGPRFVGATPDLSHVVLTSKVALTSTTKAGRQMYEWSGGNLTLISVLPDGKPATAPTLGFGELDTRQAISDDGSRITWSANDGHLYLRDMARGETVQLDAVQGGSGGGANSAGPQFQIASSDGSKVFFTDTQALTAGSDGSGGGEDLYECVIVVVKDSLKCDLSDLTPVGSTGTAKVLGGVLGVSKDGSWLYFVANGVLASGGAVHGDCGEGLSPTSSATSCNLYMRHDGTTKFVAVLSGGDAPDWSSVLIHSPVRVSSDGRWLAFMSQRELTGYDTHDAVSGIPDEEVYLYDGVSGSLVCASCDPSGARPVGQAYPDEGDSLWAGDRVWNSSTTWLASNIPGWTPNMISQSRYQSRYLSDSGRLFFNSDDGLVPRDVNGNWDVYQYEPPGIGDCATSSATFSERSDGCVALISSGESGEESGFLDASQTGGDVFFLTSGKLSGQDVDTAIDIYDAHECTADSPCLPAQPVQPPVCDTGDSCKTAPSPQPVVFGPPPSATFAGSGNVAASVLKSVTPKGLTRAQKLARALRACKEKRRGRPRTACMRRARVRYTVKRSSRAKAIRKGGR
jgi:hypothetical protein